MSTRGRKANIDKPVEWKINVPSSVVAQVSLFLIDPLTGNPRHGARSRLITQLLRGWIALQTHNLTKDQENTNEQL